MIGQTSKRDQQSDPIYYTLLKHLLGFAVPFYQLQGTVRKWWTKIIFGETNWHVLNFLHPILICWVMY
jgi:hypothetical protein